MSASSSSRTVQLSDWDSDSIRMHLPMILTLFPGVIIISLWFLIKYYSFAKPTPKKNLPPSPRGGLPVLGNLHQLKSLPHHSLHSMSEKYGPVMLLRIGKVPTLVISSAEAASQVMKTQDLIFSDRPYSRVAARLLYNMKDVSVSPYCEYWRQLKSICVLQLLSNKKVQEFRHVREEEISTAVEEIISYNYKGSVAVNLSETFISVTNDIVCRSAFGKKYGEGESGKKFRSLFTELLQILGTSYIGAFVPWLEWINRVNGFDTRIARVAEGIDRFLDGVIEERLEEKKKKSYDESGQRSCCRADSDDDYNNNNNNNVGEDFLDIMLRIHMDNSTAGVAIDRDSVKAVLLDVFSAGTDTTATVGEWVMTELIRHPRVMKKLQEEVRRIMKTKLQSSSSSDGGAARTLIVTDDDLENMHYLKAVIKETLRLHPPIPLLVPREARQDTEIMGYHVAAGTMVMINAWAIGRDPATWEWDDHEPSEFLPERFLNSSVDYRGQDFRLIPFGAGRRGCPGISFAMASNELMLANLVNRFDWELPGGVKGEDLDVAEHPGATVKRKNPLMLLATPIMFNR